MADSQLLFDSAKTATDFASSMIDWELWTAGRSKKAEARLERAQDVCDLMHRLDTERFLRTRDGKPVEHIDAIASELALEISDLSREAQADRSFKPGVYDTYVLDHVRSADDYEREGREQPVLLRAA